MSDTTFKVLLTLGLIAGFIGFFGLLFLACSVMLEAFLSVG